MPTTKPTMKSPHIYATKDEAEAEAARLAMTNAATRPTLSAQIRWICLNVVPVGWSRDRRLPKAIRKFARQPRQGPNLFPVDLFRSPPGFPPGLLLPCVAWKRLQLHFFWSTSLIDQEIVVAEYQESGL